MDKLLEFLNSLPKERRPAFCSACGTTEGYLRKAASTKPPPKFGSALCIALERESGGAIPCESLDPAPDWNFLRATAKAKRRRTPAPPP